MTRWLVDGDNVMGSRPDGWWKDRPAARARLAGEIRRWQAATGQEVVAVFDGHPDERITTAAGPEVRVRFGGSGRRNAADDVIVAEAQPGDIVVTADRGLVSRLPAGTTVTGPTSLLDALVEAEAGPTDDYHQSGPTG